LEGLLSSGRWKGETRGTKNAFRVIDLEKGGKKRSILKGKLKGRVKSQGFRGYRVHLYGGGSFEKASKKWEKKDKGEKGRRGE